MTGQGQKTRRELARSGEQRHRIPGGKSLGPVLGRTELKGVSLESRETQTEGRSEVV